MRKLIIAAFAATFTSLALPKQHNYEFYTKAQLDCITKNIYHEARGEPFQGQVLVARVTLNRAGNHSNICKVVYAKDQFSWTNDRKLRNSKVIPSEQIIFAAYGAQRHKSKATYFHAYYVKPKWAKTKTKVAEIGNHIFYV